MAGDLADSDGTTEAKEPTKEEREKADKEARAKEQAEQDALPYRWTQKINELEVIVPVSGNIRGKDLEVKFTKTHLKVALKGQAPIIDGDLAKPIRVDDSSWSLTTTGSGKEIEILLSKSNDMEWWPNVVQGAPTIDTSKIQPENSKLSDLDGETRSMVEKMMYDNRQKEEKKQTDDQRLKEFMKQHPEMDFSNVQMK